MAKELNPVAAQRKADKQKEIAKSRKTQQAQRNEKLVKRNPERLQRQVDELRELEKRGPLKPRDKETLGQLERDLRGVKKAREVLGVKDEPRRDGRRDGGGGGYAQREERGDVRQEQRERRQQLGKRRRDDDKKVEDSGGDTDPEVRNIPMPKDVPPPIPREHFRDSQASDNGPRWPHALPLKPIPAAPAQTVYSSAPQLRDLKKEAVRFMPAVVAQHRNRVKSQGRLLEPEEADKLEKSGYIAAQKAADEASLEARFEQVNSEVRGEEMLSRGLNDEELEAETKRFEEELAGIYPEEDSGVVGRGVQMEQVEDEGT